MQKETTPIFKRLWYDWTEQQPGTEPTNPLVQCWVPPIVAFYDQQGLLRTYSLPGSSIRSSQPRSPRSSLAVISIDCYPWDWRTGPITAPGLQVLSAVFIIHRPGKKHINADSPSRIPDPLPGCDCYRAGSTPDQLPCGGCVYCLLAPSQSTGRSTPHGKRKTQNLPTAAEKKVL